MKPSVAAVVAALVIITEGGSPIPGAPWESGASRRCENIAVRRKRAQCQHSAWAAARKWTAGGAQQNLSVTASASAFHGLRVSANQKDSAPVMRNRRISYALHQHLLIESKFNRYYRCQKSRPLFPPVLRAPGRFDFSTTISLDNLKVIMMGDSVAVQIAQGIDDALGTPSDPTTTREVLKYEWGQHPTGHEAIVLNDLGNGSAFATYRLLGTLGHFGEGKWRPNTAGRRGYGGWLRRDVEDLLGHSSNVTRFDAMIFQIPSGWISLEHVTAERLEETARTAHDLFSVDTVIFLTAPFTNNVQTTSDFRQMADANEKMRGFCSSWTEEKARATGVRRVMALEFGNLVQGLMEDNARALGFDLANETYW
eukprot:CAMPEP_0119281218 /NCGR_PEP_ID=MMETSP1329-20130426/24269_1 /TAXON_ID=114041 /ORGANISM="Genus nov. species nov., Strain RCC1024" /LENGTH=367 /DNA_ID=CAMNT_0007281825 /DNA_START=564 /DNA_END=1664 /DNA_ORIENTATION=-